MIGDEKVAGFRSGDGVIYRSFSGDVYDAVVSGIGPEGYVNLDVTIPGCKDAWPLRAVRVERVEPKVRETLDGEG